MDIYVDGGGSASKIYKSINNKLIYCLETKRMNIASFRKETLKNLEDIINVIKDNFIDEDLQIYIGMPGLIDTDIKKIMNKLELTFNNKIIFHIMLDVELQLIINIGKDYKKENFLYIASGTGSNSLLVYKEKVYRKGGWGHLLGDEGSSYDFTKNWICKTLKEFEQGKEGNFKKAVLEFFKIDDLNNIIDIYKQQESIKQLFSNFSNFILIDNYDFYNKEIDFIMDIISKNLAYYLLEVVDFSKISKIYYFGKLFLNNIYESNITKMLTDETNIKAINLSKNKQE